MSELSHPRYRVETEDAYDLITGFELRVLDGLILHLRVHTAYRDPIVAEARGGVSVRFGDNVAYVTIPNLDRLYQVWADPGRYMADVMMAPIEALRGAPVLQASFGTVEPEPVIHATSD